MPKAHGYCPDDAEFIIGKSTPKYSIDETIEILNGLLALLGYGNIEDITFSSEFSRVKWSK